MDIKNIDRIVITTYERFEIIIKWYLNNKELLDEIEFISPLKKGFVESKAEGFDFAFEVKGRTVHIDAYETAQNNLIIGFDYNPYTKKTTNLIYHCPKNQIPLWRGFITGDNSLYKLSIKYHSLMEFMNHYRQYVIKDESKPKAALKENKPRKKYNHSNSLIRKTYLVDGFKKKDIKNIDGKIHHSSPSYEFDVRGYYRHYKSGKVIWVDGFTKCKGKGQKQPKNYKF